MYSRLKAQLLDGKKVSEKILSEIRTEIQVWNQAGYRKPHLSVILVGNSPASLSYVGNKIKAAKAVGM